ncbi:MAG: T9SS type A sorting domain-containing protein [Bacteroidetes bacterium]|nr:T9SS type A sorting domain-containing protein [Bacteroidota bacterium]
MISFSQKEVSNWFIGKAGLDFNCNSPNPIFPNYNFNPMEGCSAISDSMGDLLFYTDGCMVYDKTHQLMINGDSIGEAFSCSGSSTQGALIVKQPLQDSLYYIFTTDCAENKLMNGFCYSIVNMNLNNGKGEVILKKQLLLNKTCEKLAASRHANGSDVWILTHEWGNSNFCAFLLTGSSLITSPIVSNCGRIQLPIDTTDIYPNYPYPECAARGYMKFSPQGDKIVVLSLSDCHSFLSYPELFSFDNSSGIVTYKYMINTHDTTKVYYGASFSPNGNLLYLSSAWHNYYGSYIHQFDLTSNDSISIANSKYNVYFDTTYISPNNTPSALQIGPDGKIYNANLSQYFNVIQQPNIYGNGCDFQLSSIFVGTCSDYYIYYGLPNNDESYYLNSYSGASCTPLSIVDFTTHDSCAYTPISFFCNSNLYPYAISYYSWDFGDPLSGTSNYSQLINPQHTYLTTGLFQIKLVVYNDYLNPCKKDSIIKSIDIKCTTVGNNQIMLVEQLVEIFPNPTSNILTIETPEKSFIEILSLQGQVIKSIHTIDKTKTIDVSNFSNGLYLIKATSEKGIVVKKFMKE